VARPRPLAVFRALPLLNVVAKRLGAERGLARAAATREILQPEEIEEVPRPLFLEGALEAVTGTTERDDLADQMAAVRATHLIHAAVTRYTLTDCAVHPHGVEWAGGSLRKHGLGMRDLVSGPLQETEDAHYPMTTVSHQYFGHFLRDACANALLRQPGQALLLDVREDWTHAAEYVRAFGLDPSPGALRLVRRLTICIDHSQGSLKRARYRELRRRVGDTFGARGPRSEDVYLRRGGCGTMRRAIRDEDALIDVLVRQGFRIVDIDGARVEDLAEALRHCRRLVSMEGSHVNHAHLLAPAGVDLCLLMPSDRFTLIHRGIANASGGRFGFVVCKRLGDDYGVDAGQLLRTLDLF
jgi:hypothetical protein